MKAAVIAMLTLVPCVVGASENSPIAKVVEMIADLEQKVIKEGESSQKVFEEYSEWCEDRASVLGHEIKTGNSEVASLRASIANEAAQIEALNSKLDSLSNAIAVDEADLKAATEIRAREARDFAAEEAELSETVSMLDRAVGILEREMAKGGTSMMQMKVEQALDVIIQASAMSSADAGKLTALVQSKATTQDADEEFGAPAATVYGSHSGDIVSTLRGLQEQAESQLSKVRAAETSNLHNFQLLKQSLADEIKFGTKDSEAAKRARSGSSERKASAEGDLQSTSKSLAADVASKAELHQDCMAKAEDFEAETKSRGEELKALAEAKKVLKESTSGAADISYGLTQVSFLQQGSDKMHFRSPVDQRNFEAVRVVREIARQDNSVALEQLAQHMATAAHNSAEGGSGDVFAKIKGLIVDMISRLEAEADADATKKSYCDKELRESNEKKTDKTAEIKKQTTRIDRMAARSSALKEDVALLQSELANLAKAQSDMDALRQKENAAFIANKAEMEKGLAGVKMALKVLTEYYASQDKAHEASGAGHGIINLLEVIESDFSRDLAVLVSAEDTAAAAYTRETKDNEIEKTTKTKDAEHKTRESAYLDKEAAALSADRDGVEAELDAVLKYLAKIEEECIAKAETYAERKRRFEKEIAGLKQALNILESETAFVQRNAHRRHAASTMFLGGR